jgi:hypothetical protein
MYLDRLRGIFCEFYLVFPGGLRCIEFGCSSGLSLVVGVHVFK